MNLKSKTSTCGKFSHEKWVRWVSGLLFFTQVEATNFFYFITCKIYQNKEKLLHNYQNLTSGCKNLETFIFSKIGQNCKKKKTSLKNWHAFAICIIGESITMYFQKLDANCAPIIRAAIKH